MRVTEHISHRQTSNVINMHMWILAISSFATFFSFIEMFDVYGDICRGLCVCEERDGILTASCENRGINNLSDVTPLQLTSYHLLLAGNLLKKISLDDFVSYEGLTILHLGNNDISELEPGAFNGLQGLKRLHLNNNKIEALQDDTFLGLESLEYLQMDYNYISHIEPKALSRLHHLEVFILNDNLLSALPFNVFQFVPLTHLDLRGNQLKVLPYNGLLEHMSRIVELQLEENPWNCSCELIALKAWLESISYTPLVGDVVCETPFRLHGRDLDEISKQELCPRRAIAEFEMRAEPAHSSEVFYKTTPATVRAAFASSTVLRPTKSSRLSGKLRVKPTSHSSSGKPQNYGPMLAYQTKPPVSLDCPSACTCNLQISDLGLNVNCQERKIESISDLNPKPYNPKKMYLTGNYISSVCSSDFVGSSGLDLLHLGNNRVTVIHDRTFGQLIHLRRLYLNGNLLERLTEEMFYGLQSLQFLYLEYNVIREIAADAFHQAPNLQLLFLNNNLLKMLPVGIFDGLNLARLSLRSNHFRSLPVGGVLEELTSLVQIDLFENPWDCSCPVLDTKNWLEQLGAGTVVNSVICESPPRLSGEDVRHLRSSHLCPENSNVESSDEPPSEDSFPGSTITLETALDYGTQSPAVPLSVLILALLLIFILSVFVAAGLFAVIMKRRKKSERLASLNATASSFNAIYQDGAAGKSTSAGHVYEYIPPAVGSVAKHLPYSPSEGNEMKGYRDFEELRALAAGSDEEVRSNAISSEFSAGTPDALNRRSPLLDDNYFYRDILARDQQASHRASLACKHGPPDFDARHQCVNPDRKQQVYCTTPAGVYTEPGRSEYWELKAKLHFEPDYLEVHEKRTTFTQF
ncbi:SLIT and NTRK-like protein 5 [Triplophysa rosa]|uniref:SLIT and NTRK-like protein 5 n=1 Tax=Triplophysa rosa TaxID=992332 RepID=A0A9W7WU42_TRIRA|nr:SLIT and NTRK-like protein 5 [Triplophysa rosa]KAI7808447.1 putative SLIT and NTRK-like protein 5 [Triplophysa rosa]